MRELLPIGFSASNLWRARLFHEAYAPHAKLAPLVRDIAWSHKHLPKDLKGPLAAPKQTISLLERAS
jgi:hypothetical protein